MKYVYIILITGLIVWFVATTKETDGVNFPIIVDSPQNEVMSSFEHYATPSSTPSSPKVLFSSGFDVSRDVERRLGYSVEEKYKELLNYLDFSSSLEGKNKLLSLLEKRELAESGYSIEGDFLDVDKSFTNRAQYLDDIDAEIINNLSAEDREKYQVLKNSSAQQAQLEDFYQLYPKSANISSEHKTKLLYEKARFDLRLADSISIDKALIDDVSKTNKESLVKSKKTELLSQQDAYLKQVEELLPEEDVEMFKFAERETLETYLNQIYNTE